MERSHSLFGQIWQIADATGWSLRYILWGVPYSVLMLMIADAPRLVKERTPNSRGGARRASAEAIFQTMLNEKADR